MSADERTKPIGAILARLGGERLPRVPRPTNCGGAMLFLSREEAQAVAKGPKNPHGVTFDTDPEQLPGSGRESIRVRCGGEVATIGHVTYALCSRCCGLEAGNRRHLAGKAKEAALAARSSRPAKKFSEAAE